MPGLIRRMVMVAETEGLTLYPWGQHNQPSLQIKYATHEISSIETFAIPAQSVSAVIYGVVGLLTLTPFSYLITISRREQVAQIRGNHIYVITNVSLVPLTSQAEAIRFIIQDKANLKKAYVAHTSSHVDRHAPSDGEDNAGDSNKGNCQASPTDSEPPIQDDNIEARPGISNRSSSRAAENVIVSKGLYGRFMGKWFSEKGWSTESRRVQGMSTDGTERPWSASYQGGEPGKPTSQGSKGTKQSAKPDDSTTKVTNPLLPKLLQTTRILLESRSFFFAYDLDITRRIGSQETKLSELPLYKVVDAIYFWNQHLALPLIEGGHHSFILPLMQGFVGQRAFTIRQKPEEPLHIISNTQKDEVSIAEPPKQLETNDICPNFLLTLISRRSIKRSGLRYLRRGVNEAGDTANTVETEQILFKASWAPDETIYSFTQLRGSIPLFFFQSPYSFKPVPILQHSPRTNQRAFQRHFDTLFSRYGGVQIALLVDKKGSESEIGQKYEQTTKELNARGGIMGKEIGFEWFDFHDVCRAKFENVALLVDALGPKLEEFGYTIKLGSRIQQSQSGILRTNCMDCLDRTNVVQSACGQRALEQQLQSEGVKADLQKDTTTDWFNTLWADNGDQLSREYASTAALKGDYTRTRQRNYRGTINDFGLTLSRYFNNIVNDYFAQAAIDYLLGNVTLQIFEEFEATMQNRDPAISAANIRANAIEMSSKIVIANQDENLVGGWTLLSPRETNTVQTSPHEECVLLITDAALYCVKMTWDEEKVASFERVDLQNIIGLMKGTYITSTLTATQIDEVKNVGFVVKYASGTEDSARANTRSLSGNASLSATASDAVNKSPVQKITKNGGIALNVLAFKALPAKDSLSGIEAPRRLVVSEQELVNHLCEQIKRAALGDGNDAVGFIENTDIISLDEAKKSTGLVQQWAHSLKKMVWA